MRRRLYGFLASGGVETIAVTAASYIKSDNLPPCIQTPGGDFYDLTVDGKVCHSRLRFDDIHYLDVPKGFSTLGVSGFQPVINKKVSLDTIGVAELRPFMRCCPYYFEGHRGDTINTPDSVYFPDGGYAYRYPILSLSRYDANAEGVYSFAFNLSHVEPDTWSVLSLAIKKPGNYDKDAFSLSSDGGVLTIREDCPSSYDPNVTLRCESWIIPFQIRVLD